MIVDDGTELIHRARAIRESPGLTRSPPRAASDGRPAARPVLAARAGDHARSMPFDATLKDLGRDSPDDFLMSFDRPPTAAVSLLNVDLSTVTTAADLILGLGDPPAEVI